MKEMPCRQKLRELWMKEGGRNTGFFHKMANAHRRGNQITKMRINGVWITEEIELKQGIVEAFKSLLSETEEWR